MPVNLSFFPGWPAPLCNLYFDSFLLICTSFVVRTRGIVCVVYLLFRLANYKDPCKRCVLAPKNRKIRAKVDSRIYGRWKLLILFDLTKTATKWLKNYQEAMKRPKLCSTVSVQPNQAKVCSTVGFVIRRTGPATWDEGIRKHNFQKAHRKVHIVNRMSRAINWNERESNACLKNDLKKRRI